MKVFGKWKNYDLLNETAFGTKSCSFYSNFYTDVFFLARIFLNFADRNKKKMAKSKANRHQVILECTEHKDSGQPGTSRYITTKNRKNTTGRLELKKYNPILKRYTIHKEIK